MNKCRKCKDLKPEEDFPKDKTRKSGYSSECKKCKKEYRESNKKYFQEFQKKKYQDKKEEKKIYAKINKEKIKEYQKNYRDRNRETLNEKSKDRYYNNLEIRRSKLREYQRLNKSKRNEDIKERRKKDINFKILSRIRSLISNSINRKGYSKKSKSFEILGCSFEEFKKHIESKFETWMTWENHGLYNGQFNYGWDIDHIKPTSSAKTEEEILKLNHYTNLQPLCSKVNRDIKRNFIEMFHSTSDQKSDPTISDI